MASRPVDATAINNSIGERLESATQQLQKQLASSSDGFDRNAPSEQCKKIIIDALGEEQFDRVTHTLLNSSGGSSDGGSGGSDGGSETQLDHDMSHARETSSARHQALLQLPSSSEGHVAATAKTTVVAATAGFSRTATAVDRDGGKSERSGRQQAVIAEVGNASLSAQVRLSKKDKHHLVSKATVTHTPQQQSFQPSLDTQNSTEFLFSPDSISPDNIMGALKAMNDL